MAHQINFALTLTLVTAAFVGCNNPSNLDDVALPIPASENLPAETTSTVVVKQTPNDVSPAAAEFSLPDADASPELVSRKFIQFLNSEARENFELLLTPAALNAVTRSKFQLPPIADANAKFDFGEPAFATIRQKMCFVECQIDDDENSLSDFSLMLRKTNSGWRVAGMMLQDESNSTSNLLSFESATDLNQIKASVQYVDADGEQH